MPDGPMMATVSPGRRVRPDAPPGSWQITTFALDGAPWGHRYHPGPLAEAVREVWESGMTVKEQEKAHEPDIIAESIHTALTSTITWPAYSVKPDPQRAAMSYLPDWVTDPLLKLALGR